MTQHSKRPPFFLVLVILLSVLAACAGNQDNANTTATRVVPPPPTQKLTLMPRPEKIVAMMKQRGEEDQAKPVLKIVAPANGVVIEGSTVSVKLTLGGDLKGYKVFKDPVTGMGNHIHVILDNEPYEAYYDLTHPYEFKNVSPGVHTVRVFPSRPWHESYKNEGAFQMVKFTVKGSAPGGSARTGAENVDLAKPLSTYSRPKGEYKGEDADPIMIDFWLTNAKLKSDGGEFRVRYIIDDDDPRYLDKWEPIWLSGWINGKHRVRLELLGADQFPVKNGDFNITTREITVVK